jgi:galactose mutarotase-like enzyme
VDYQATTTKPAVIKVAQHSYFNLLVRVALTFWTIA